MMVHFQRFLKTDFIYFSSKFKPCSLIPNLSVESHQIMPFDTILNLVVRFDKHFLFKDRISNLCRSASLSLSRISKIRSYLDVKTVERLVHIFVTAKLDYCNSLPCDLPKCQISRLQRIQNTAARIVTLTKKNDNILHQYFETYTGYQLKEDSLYSIYYYIQYP